MVQMTDPKVKERPINFDESFIPKLFDGTKTQTRRLIKVEMISPNGCPLREIVPSLLIHRGDLWDARYEIDNPVAIRCPYGKPGDLLWVREAFARRLDVDPAEEPGKARHYALYRANGTGLDEPHWHSYPQRWTPATRMPRWASRITLEITDIRIERLGDISEADKIAEGATPDQPFGTVWRKVHTKPGERFENSPWVWVLEFRRIDPTGGRP